MHIHLRVHRWVLWWLSVGVACGAVALVNIFTRELTRSQDHVILLFGVVFWVLGGAVCWASEAIQRHEPPELGSHHDQTPVSRPVADATPHLLNHQWQRFAARDAVSRFRGHHG